MKDSLVNWNQVSGSTIMLNYPSLVLSKTTWLTALYFVLALLPHTGTAPAKKIPAEERETWDLVIQTCDRSGAGTNAAVFAKIQYENHDQETFKLDGPGDDFERGLRDHFRLSLSRNDPIKLGIYWWPSGTLREALCVDWALLLSPSLDKCFVGFFDKWIGHYSDPPTYPEIFKEMDFARCIDMPKL